MSFVEDVDNFVAGQDIDPQGATEEPEGQTTEAPGGEPEEVEADAPEEEQGPEPGTSEWNKLAAQKRIADRDKANAEARQRAAEQRLAQREQQLEQLAERLEALAGNGGLQGVEASEGSEGDGTPDPDQDPLGSIMARFEALEGAIKGQQEETQKEREAREAREAIKELSAQATQNIQRFVQEVGQEQYVEALDHLNTQLIEETMVQYQVTQEEAAQALNQEAQKMILRLQHQGRNPGQAIWDLALARGFTPAQEQEGQATAPDQGEGSTHGTSQKQPQVQTNRPAASSVATSLAGASPKRKGLTRDSVLRAEGTKFDDLTDGMSFSEIIENLN